MTATRSDIENAILDATGRPDSGTIRDNLGVMVDAVLRVVAPAAVPAAKPVKDSKIENKTQETRIVSAEETR
jgi:hypothetical protein